MVCRQLETAIPLQKVRVMSWHLFQGNGEDRSAAPLPPPPPWRDFSRTARDRAATYRVQPEEVDLVNAALYLRRPLLVTGPPGSGKSSLIRLVAEELGLGEVLVWPINSRSTLAEGLYRYDAVARLRDYSRRTPGVGTGTDDEADIDRYLTLGPLGTALLPHTRPRALLIDEIDKSDIDLPNDLLHVFEEGYYEIPELKRIAGRHPQVSILTDGREQSTRARIEHGRIQVQEFPFVIITSNGERDLPPAFLRRCLRLETRAPDASHLAEVLRAHLGQVSGTMVDELIQQFVNVQSSGRWISIDQLLNAVFLATGKTPPQNFDSLRTALMRTLNEA